MNKFYTLNQIQRSTVDCKDFYHDGERMPCWEVRASYTFEGVTRSRCVSFIMKENGVYRIALTRQVYKTFMAALASLIPEYIFILNNLIKSMMFGYHDDDICAAIQSAYHPAPQVTKPRLPTYDRGPKKQVLHPLRRHVTKHYEGRYSR